MLKTGSRLMTGPAVLRSIAMGFSGMIFVMSGLSKLSMGSGDVGLMGGGGGMPLGGGGGGGAPPPW